MSDPAWYQRSVFYEVPIRAFSDADGDGSGDIAGLIAKLDYLQWLGVDCVWLLPFFDSPLRDGGYDVRDFRTVLREFGTIDDVHQLVDDVHRRGMRIIADMLINHTSDTHEWFQEARKPGSAKRDWYVWSDSDERYGDARVIFLDHEPSNWTWDDEAGAYYWHRFYHHQPDLNFDNVEVQEAMLDEIRFWLDVGFDGLRLDAVPYLIEREGTNCENLPETHAYLKRVRAMIDAEYDDRMILAEANQWPHDVVAYFGDGDECHMAYHFPLMPRLYMALRQADATSLVDILNATPDIPDGCQWGIFLRNHDELTLEMVTEEERQYMWREYAPDPAMKSNLGIRRRLATLLDGDRARIELLHSLLLSLPGSPFLYYGDEIGMGDDYSLPDRDGLRTPMQWTTGQTAGFSAADPADLYLPVVSAPGFGPDVVNVADQRADGESLLNWIRSMLELRSAHPVLATGAFELVATSHTAPVVQSTWARGCTRWSCTAMAAAAPSQSVALTGTIADGDVWVLANSQAADATIQAETDQFANGVINFNGDDAVVLRKNGVVVDAFGQIGVDPGSEWVGGGQDDTLRRMEDVCAGDTNANDAFDASDEWDSLAQNTVDGLGTHTANCDGGSGAADLFMSEYVEGSGFNKAIEIYNGTGGAVDMGAGLYTLELYSNGAAAPSQSVALTGTIADGDVWVLANSQAADATIQAETDQFANGVINFNGDDAVVLRKNGVVVDAFGQIGVDPGSEWVGGGQDDTLRRMEDVCAGDTNADDAFDASDEWDSLAQNTVDGLGTHTANCDGGSGAALVIDCGAPLGTDVGVPASTTITASDADDTVVAMTLVSDDVSPGGNLTAGTFTASTGVGDPATLELNLDGLADGGFYTATVQAQNSTGDTTTCDLEIQVVAVTKIHDVQGSGAASPLVGDTVIVEGIVVGDFQDGAAGTNGDLNGFHVQEENADADSNPLTSEGIFVFNGSNPSVDVNIGDLVRVQGPVSEFNGLTEITSFSGVTVLSSGNSLPTPAAPTLPVITVDDFEAFEGMSVTFPQDLVISEYFNFDRFGEIVLTTDRRLTPTAEFEPGPAAVAAAADFLLNRITLDDGRTSQNPDPAIHPNGGVFDLTNLFRGGDTVANVTGVMDYAFGLYRIQPTQGADYTNTNLRTAAPDPVGGDVTVASFNVLNYFTTIDDGVNDICGPDGNLECRGADDAERAGLASVTRSSPPSMRSTPTCSV